jgi:UDP-N-acetyl-D-galactosamine dehydrogenase
VVRLMVKKGIAMPKARILVMGVTFKENCPDVRNTRVIDVIEELEAYGASVDVYDPWVDIAEVKQAYGIEVSNELPESGQYDGIVMAVAHQEFCAMTPDEIHGLGKDKHIIYDIKYVMPTASVDGRL